MRTEATTARPEELSVADDGRVSSQSGSRGFRPDRRWWPGAVCLGLYLILTVLEFGPSTSLGGNRIAVEGGSDGASQIWFLEWTQYALAHGHNPFFSQWQSFPTGLNVGADTSMVALGAIFSPITIAVRADCDLECSAPLGRRLVGVFDVSWFCVDGPDGGQPPSSGD